MILEPVESDEDHRRDEVGAVVHRDVWLVLEGGGDVAVVTRLVLPLDGVDRDVEVVDQAGRDVILGRERVRGNEDQVSPAGDWRVRARLAVSAVTCRQADIRKPASGFSISNRSRMARSTGMSRSAQRMR